jgi:restriction endonuclease
VREQPDGQHKVYLVRETKGTTDWHRIPEYQRKKTQCGKAHFKAVGLPAGGYEWVASAREV